MPFDESYLRVAVRELHSYIPGKPAEVLERESGVPGALKLASNENPSGPSPLVLAALRDSARVLPRYGDASCHGLVAALARHHGLPEDHFVVTNGASESILLAAQMVAGPGDEVIYAHGPSFPLYRTAALLAGATPVPVPLREHTHDLAAMRAAVTPRTRVVYLCNPNNPTGTAFGAAALDPFLDGLPERVLVVCDHAYADYVRRTDYPDLLPRIRAGENLLLLRTFSKVHSLAALRVAYVCASPGWARSLHRVRMPFNVNVPAQLAAVAALRDSSHVRDSVRLAHRSLDRMREGLAGLPLEVIPSETNFLMLRLAGDARPLVQELERRGVIVRGLVSFGSTPEFVRVSSGTMEETERFLKTFREVLSGVAIAG